MFSYFDSVCLWKHESSVSIGCFTTGGVEPEKEVTSLSTGTNRSKEEEESRQVLVGWEELRCSLLPPPGGSRPHSLPVHCCLFITQQLPPAATGPLALFSHVIGPIGSAHDRGQGAPRADTGNVRPPPGGLESNQIKSLLSSQRPQEADG